MDSRHAIKSLLFTERSWAIRWYNDTVTGDIPEVSLVLVFFMNTPCLAENRSAPIQGHQYAKHNLKEKTRYAVCLRGSQIKRQEVSKLNANIVRHRDKSLQAILRFEDSGTDGRTDAKY